MEKAKKAAEIIIVIKNLLFKILKEYTKAKKLKDKSTSVRQDLNS